MMSIPRRLRQTLHATFNIASSFSQTAIKAPAADIHTCKLLELHNTLHTTHCTQESQVDLHGLRLHDMHPACPANCPAHGALHYQGWVMTERPFELRSLYPPVRASIAGTAQQAFAAVISTTAESQTNNVLECQGRLQNKYSHSRGGESGKRINSQTIIDQPKTTGTSAAVSEISKDVAASIFGNEVKKAQRTLSIQDLANAYDL